MPSCSPARPPSAAPLTFSARWDVDSNIWGDQWEGEGGSACCSSALVDTQLKVEGCMPKHSAAAWPAVSPFPPPPLQVDALVPGLLGANRTVFASAYCNRREVPRPGTWLPGGLLGSGLFACSSRNCVRLPRHTCSDSACLKSLLSHHACPHGLQATTTAMAAASGACAMMSAGCLAALSCTTCSRRRSCCAASSATCCRRWAGKLMLLLGGKQGMHGRVYAGVSWAYKAAEFMVVYACKPGCPL